MHWPPLRIVQKRWKAVYIVGGYAASFPIFFLVNLLPFDWVVGVLTSAIQFGWVYFGTRIFRGSSELLIAARPAWRMTAKPTAGFLLGALWIALLGANIPLILEGQLAIGVTGVGEFLVLAVLYVVSSVRLLRAPR